MYARRVWSLYISANVTTIPWQVVVILATMPIIVNGKHNETMHRSYRYETVYTVNIN